MQMISNVLAMGGYGAYIWAAYATAATILLGLLIIFLRQLRNASAKISELEANSPQRRRNNADGEDVGT